MTKTQYLNELRKELKANSVGDIEDIIAEYEEHFDFKAEEGVTEEETARKLSSPQEIAAEYGRTAVSVNKFEKSFKVGGLTLLSLPLSLIYVLMWCSVALLGIFALVCTTAGFCLITRANIAGLIPYMPYFSSFITGIALLGLAILSAVGAVYTFMYVKQWGKAYIKWCANIVSNSRCPGLSKHPRISKKLSFQIKTDRHDRTCLFHFRIRNRLHFNVYRCRQYGAVARLEMVSIIYCRKVIYFFANY